MARRIALFVLLCYLFPPRAVADDFDDVRLRWKTMLTGGPALDTSLSVVRVQLGFIRSAALSAQSTTQRSANFPPMARVAASLRLLPAELAGIRRLPAQSRARAELSNLNRRGLPAQRC